MDGKSWSGRTSRKKWQPGLIFKNGISGDPVMISHVGLGGSHDIESILLSILTAEAP